MSAQTLTTLVKFNGTHGGQPEFSLLQAPDGNFYGTTSLGGTKGGGTVFKMTPAGKLTVLYNFCSLINCNDGATAGQLVLASDGNAYGFTVTGGANCHDLADIGCGTIFKPTPQKTLVTLYSFCVHTNCTDGWNPDSLIQASDGNFYGTTFHGGPHGAGVAFKITPDGAFTVLYGGNQTNDGSIFKITPGGTLTTLHQFAYTDGAFPSAALIQSHEW